MFIEPFFKKELEEAKVLKEAQRRAAPTELKTEEDCEACGLYRQVRSPKMKPTGYGSKQILVVVEAPGGAEDANNKQLHEDGEAGALIRRILAQHGIDLDFDCWKINAVNCRPTDSDGSNRTPSPKEIACCRPLMMKAIEDLKPKAIFLMGAVSVDSFLMDRSDTIRRSPMEDKKRKPSIDTWRGLSFPDLKSGAWVYPLLHPAYILRNPSAEHVLSRDIGNALKHFAMSKPPTKFAWEKYTKILDRYENVIEFLNRVQNHEFGYISIDYETTGLKPYREGHRIVCASIGYLLGNSPRAVSFPISYPGIFTKEQQDQILCELRAILNDSMVKKIAQNIQMEEKWSRRIVGCEVQGWWHDTMQTSHILDERDLFTSLDKQVFLNFGYEYGAEVSYYKKGFPFNKMEQCPLPLLLQYSALDSLFTLMLFGIQTDALAAEPRLKEANDFWLESVLTFCDLEDAGIHIDEKYYEKTIAEIENEVSVLSNEVFASTEVAQFKARYNRMPDLGDKGGVTLDLSTLFFEVLNLTPIKTTATGKPTLDEEALDHYNNVPIAAKINRLRKLNKTKTTYLAGYLREVVNGTIYPNSNLHLVRTYRSSMDNPNLQNVPARDEDAKKIVRRGILPPEGYRIATVDYGSHEVRIIASFFGDPALIQDVITGHDLHGDYAKELGLHEQRPWKQARYDGKNAFVFPEFYGSWYMSVAKDLRSRGYEITDERVQRTEHVFWDKYSVTRRKQKELIDFYQSSGYIEMFWGHRRRGVISKNQIANTTIQGSAFHCLLWSLNKVNKLRRAEGWKSYVPAQIHDELFWYLHEDEIPYVVRTVTKIMQEDIVAENPFLKVPLLAEWSFCEPGASWYDKKGVDPDKLEKWLEEL